MILAAIVTVLSAFSVAYVSAKGNLPKWLPPAYLGYCLVAIVLALRFMGWSAPYHTAELYLTAIVFVLCLVCAYIGALVGRSMRAWEDKRAA
jgi:Ca2+/Na+ antiporter